MDWKIWRQRYVEIVDRLGLDVEMDREASELLNGLVRSSEISKLVGLIDGKECIVFGAGPSLEADLKKLSSVGFLNGRVLIPADGATEAVVDFANPDVIVTDLDGNLGPQMEAWKKGSWMVVHGHGDNINELRENVPKLDERVIGTSQVDPPGSLFNFGGFTDGDRAAFMAHELGAVRVHLAGMDLGEEIGKHSGRTEEKSKLVKLEICKELLSWLAGDLGANVVNLTLNGEKIPGVPSESLSGNSAG